LNLIYRSLGDLASQRLQHHFIRDATAESYLVPHDMLNDAENAVRYAKDSATLTVEQQIAIAGFGVVLDDATPDLNRADLIDAGPEWARLRIAVGVCLTKLEFDLEKYEADELAE
jgi:hypothetical protein